MTEKEMEALQREYWLTLMNEYLFRVGVITHDTKENIANLIDQMD